MIVEQNIGPSQKSLRAKSKQTREEQLRKLLTRKSGATIAQIQKTMGWQPHTARAAISRLRKSGSEIERQISDKGSVYRVVSAEPKQ